MIIICLAICFQCISIQFKSIQFNSMHIVFPWRKHSIHVVLPWREQSIHYIHFIKCLFVVLWHRRKAHHSQPSLSRTHFISLVLTLLVAFQMVTHFIRWLIKCVGFTSVLIRDHRHHHGAPERSIYCSRLNLSYITVLVHFSSFCFISLHFSILLQYTIQ